MGKTYFVDMEKVCKLTQEKLWTFAELARRAHLSTTTISSLKAKRRKSSALTVYKIAAALDVSPAEITREGTI